MHFIGERTLALLVMVNLLGAASAQDVVVIESTGHPAELGYAFGVVAGGEDYTGDGVLDFIVGEVGINGGPSSAVLYSGATNAPAGVIVPESPTSLGQLYVYALPDLTGDGRGDFAVVSQQAESIDVRSGAAPHGVAYSIAAVPDAWMWPIVSILDTSGDGIPEFVASDRFVHSGSNGGFLFEISFPAGYRLLDVADMDDDGDTDFILGNTNATVGVFSGCGNVRIVDSTGTTVREIADPAPVVNGAFGWSGLALPDSTGDGVPELVITSSSSPVRAPRVFNGATGGLLHTLAPHDGTIGDIQTQYVHSAPDVDGDGRADFFIVDGEASSFSGLADAAYLPKLRVHSSQSYAHLATLMPESFPRAGFLGAFLCTLDDTDGDGIPDPVVGCPTINNSPSTGQVIRFLTTTSALESEPAELHFGRRKLDRGPSIPLELTVRTTIPTAGGTILNITITGPDSSAFAADLAFTFPRVVEPDRAVAIPIRFTPTRAGLHQATMHVTTNHTTVPVVDAALSGIGDAAAVGNSIVWAFGREGTASEPRLFRLNANTEGLSSVVLVGVTPTAAPYARGIRVVESETIAIATNSLPQFLGGPAISDVYEVNAQTGTALRITASGTGPSPENVRGLVVGNDGAYYVNSRPQASESILRIDRSTGNRTVVSGSGAGTGPDLPNVLDMIMDESGDLLVATEDGLHRVVIVSGDRTLIGSGSSTPITGMCLVAPGTMAASHADTGEVVLVSTVDGSEAVVSGGSVGAGPPLIAPSGISRDADGSYLVHDTGYRGILRVHVPSGDRELLTSGFAHPSLPRPANGYHFMAGEDGTPASQLARMCSLLAVNSAPPPSASSNWDAYE